MQDKDRNIMDTLVGQVFKMTDTDVDNRDVNPIESCISRHVTRKMIKVYFSDMYIVFDKYAVWLPLSDYLGRFTMMYYGMLLNRKDLVKESGQIDLLGDKLRPINFTIVKYGDDYQLEEKR